MDGPARIGLALSGGGAKAAFEAGVIAELEQHGLSFDVLAGTSAGALNAAALASGMAADDLVAMWEGLQSRDVYRPRLDVHRLVRLRRALDPRGTLGALLSGGPTVTDHLLDAVDWSWLLDTGPLRERLVDVLGGEEVPVTDGRVLTVPAVDLTTGRLVRFTSAAPPERRSNEDTLVGPLTVDHLLASAAIPLLFRPPRVGGQLYWDGGLVANTPLRAALQHEPDICFVVATGTVAQQAAEPPSLGAAAALVIDHVLRYALLADVDHARTVNALVAAAPDATKHKLVDFVLIAPDDPSEGGLGDLLDFEPERARREIAAGRRSARAALEAWVART